MNFSDYLRRAEIATGGAELLRKKYPKTSYKSLDKEKAKRVTIYQAGPFTCTVEDRIDDWFKWLVEIDTQTTKGMIWC